MTKNWDTDFAQHCLGYLDQGISVMSPDLTLVFINQRFKELLQLPEHLMRIGTPLDAVFRYNASRGEYGPGDIETLVQERMVLARKKMPHSFERIRPDGVVLKIDGNPLPGGGFVTTYSDITELHNSKLDLQKTNEALDERVKRRTAELALRETELSNKAGALETIMETVGAGLALFDRDLKLVASNRLFIEILGYPARFSHPGTSFKEFVHFNARRGEYGDGPVDEVAAKLIDTIRKSEPHFEIRQRQNGRYVDLRILPASVGVVASYRDVT